MDQGHTHFVDLFIQDLLHVDESIGEVEHLPLIPQQLCQIIVFGFGRSILDVGVFTVVFVVRMMMTRVMIMIGVVRVVVIIGVRVIIGVILVVLITILLIFIIQIAMKCYIFV